MVNPVIIKALFPGRVALGGGPLDSHENKKAFSKVSPRMETSSTENRSVLLKI